MAHGAEHERDPLRMHEIVDASAGFVDHLQRVHPDVALGMPLRLLRTTGERLQFRKQRRDDAKIHCERETGRRPRREQQFFDFAPDAFSRQIVERNRPAQRARLLVEFEIEPGHELHGAQHPQAVIGKRVPIDHPQTALGEVLSTVKRIEVLLSERIP